MPKSTRPSPSTHSVSIRLAQEAERARRINETVARRKATDHEMNVDDQQTRPVNTAIAVSSTLKLVIMGHGFGELYKLRSIVTYALSPFEQRAFAGIISKGLPNVFKRTMDNIFYVLPPTLGAYLIYTSVERAHAQSLRKNPDDYKDEE
ncbi:hypothetical protein RN001_002465 [Aquatica leii]|uniref:Cytochrome b-c1 complex subunit 8 n=1 Tax=Aquatica leii TaxID=1421715 RepID=A0AAN7PGZ2_9COLE|nr:hypothetical protein RN001_002465 [Aquatica leii]